MVSAKIPASNELFLQAMSGKKISIDDINKLSRLEKFFLVDLIVCLGYHFEFDEICKIFKKPNQDIGLSMAIAGHFFLFDELLMFGEKSVTNRMGHGRPWSYLHS